MRLTLDGVRVELGDRDVVSGADLTAEAGEFVGLVGPNGCGKSTLLRAVYRALRPAAGLISLDGDDVFRLTAREAARRTAVLAQESSPEFDFTTREVVAMGRIPHKGPLDWDTADDQRICDAALDRVGMSGSATRTFVTLSGGERQRVLIARALAQRSRLLLLDEPTNHLDVRYQLEVLHLVRDLGLTSLAALHDLNHAAAFCDRVYVMTSGHLIAGGSPEDVLTGDRIAEVFGVRAHRLLAPGNGRMHLLFERLDGKTTACD